MTLIYQDIGSSIDLQIHFIDGVNGVITKHYKTGFKVTVKLHCFVAFLHYYQATHL